MTASDLRNRYMLGSVLQHRLRTREIFTAERAAGLAAPAVGDYGGEDLDPRLYRVGAFDHLACPSIISGQPVYPRALATHARAISPAKRPRD